MKMRAPSFSFFLYFLLEHSLGYCSALHPDIPSVSLLDQQQVKNAGDASLGTQVIRTFRCSLVVDEAPLKMSSSRILLAHFIFGLAYILLVGGIDW